MEDMSSVTVAPPLPPKTRLKAPPSSATVYISSPPKLDSHSFSYTQVQGPERNQETSNTEHVVKIKINPTQTQNSASKNNSTSIIDLKEIKSSEKRDNTSSVVNLTSENFERNPNQTSENISRAIINLKDTRPSEKKDGLSSIVNLTSENFEPCVRINVGNTESEDMIQNNTTETFLKAPERANPYFFYSAFPANAMVISSGQCSPSDTLDSGTCSDLDSTPPPLPKKKSVSVTVIGAEHKRGNSITSGEIDSDNDSNISCDSLNSSELNEDNKGLPSPSPIPINKETKTTELTEKLIPKGLLQDIRDHSKTDLSQNDQDIREHSKISITDSSEHNGELESIVESQLESEKPLVNESTYEERQIEKQQNEINNSNNFYEADKYYKFHLNENVIEEDGKKVQKDLDDDELFAGYKDILGNSTSSTIRSAKGTVRGVKNRVRAGIATFLQINSTAKVR